MTDRELLEDAARAYGRSVVEWIYADGGVEVAMLDDGAYWQPLLENGLTDCMGDALRLAVKLRMQVRVENYGGAARIDDGRWSQCEARLYGGIEAATRRAIVRAAAALTP